MFLQWYINKKEQLAFVILYKNLFKNKDAENSILGGYLEIDAWQNNLTVIFFIIFYALTTLIKLVLDWRNIDYYIQRIN